MTYKTIEECNTDSLLALRRIYEKYTRGSKGFCDAVFSQCGYGVTQERIAELAKRAETPEAFQNLWEYGVIEP